MKPDTLNPYGAMTFPRTKLVALIGALLGCAALIPARADTPAAAAEFGGQCVEGLSQGRHIMTKCAVAWADKDGKTYCFNSEDSKKSFLENPGANLQKARDFIAASSADSTEKAMQNFDSGDAETLVKGLIEERAKANGGLFPFGDPADGTQLKLAFDGISLQGVQWHLARDAGGAIGGTGPEALPKVTIMPRRRRQSSDSMKVSPPTAS